MTAAPRILLVEDDEEIVDVLRRGLEAEGYAVEVALCGQEGLDRSRRADHALIILDRMLPDIDGGEVCRMLRGEGRQTLVLMLTARDGVEDKIEGLRLGADDYLTKPFFFEELLARMEALLRRASQQRREEPLPELRVGDLVLDRARMRAFRGEREITLTATEFTLLSYLMENAGTVVSRQQILSAVWGYSFDPQTNIVDVYVLYLRRKVDGRGESPLITTVRGSGYLLAT